MTYLITQILLCLLAAFLLGLLLGWWLWSRGCNRKIEETVHAIIAEAFSNSPPYWMTVSGCASGNGGNNLPGDRADDFADYLTEVVRHYRDSHNIVFHSLEPMNEPDADWWKAGNNQAGEFPCAFVRFGQTDHR